MSTERERNMRLSSAEIRRKLLYKLAQAAPRQQSPVLQKLATLGVPAAATGNAADLRLQRLERLWKDARQVGTDRDLQAGNPHARSKVAAFFEDAGRNKYATEEIALFMDLVVARQQGR